MQLKDRSFVLIDIETTGYDNIKHQILEIGMLIIKNMKIISNINIPIKHKEYTISESAMSANKININEHEKNALDLEEAAGIFLDFLKKYKDTEEAFIPIGQNIDFDLRFIEAMFNNLDKTKEYREFISYRKLDIMQLALIKNMEEKIELEKQDLDYLLRILNIHIPEDRHRALTDCYLEFEVLKKLLDL